MKLNAIQSPNAIVEIYDDHVKKILKKGATAEKLKRFMRECEILRNYKNIGTNIVQVIDINTHAIPPWYTMKRYSGDSNDLLNLTKENVAIVANLLLPIITTLKVLSELEHPIYHRDIKPENILYENDGNNIQLVLADFGCAYFHDPDADRITLEYRSVGARSFLAPEYHHGRVDLVNEKGDIFSIGKLLWYFANGVAGDVFPYTLWFPQEYNLLNRFPGVVGIPKLVAIIASCSHHDPSKRTNYSTLIESLESLIENSNMSSDADRKLKAMMYEQRYSLEVEQVFSMSKTLIEVFLHDTSVALSSLHEQYGDLKTIHEIITGYRLVAGVSETLNGVVYKQSNYPLWNFKINNISITSRFYPAKEAKSHSMKGIIYPFIELSINTTNSREQSYVNIIKWYFRSDNSLEQFSNDKVSGHNPHLFTEILIQALDHCFS